MNDSTQHNRVGHHQVFRNTETYGGYLKEEYREPLYFRNWKIKEN